MKLSSANILKEGKRQIRALNDPCDASCATWFACANSKPNGTCTGFVLMNGQTRKHLDKILNEDDAIYVQNCVRMLQNGDTSENKESLVEEVLRFIPPQPTQRETGFSYMAQCARAVSTTPTPEQTEPEREERASSGFTAMLSASSKGKETDKEAVQRVLDEIEADEKKYRRQSSEPTRQGVGFGNMLEASRRGTFEGDEEFKPQPETRSGYGFRAMLDGASRGNATGESVETRDDAKPIPYGLAAMLDAMSPNRTRDTLGAKSGFHRGMGFANMLRGAAEGTE